MSEIISDPDKLSDFEQPWNRLNAQAGTPFCSYAWTQAAASAFYPPGSLRVIVAGSGDSIDAILPLVVCNRRRLRYLEIVGASVLNEPSAILYTHETALAETIRALIRLRLPVYLNKTVADTALAGRLQALARRQLSVLMPRTAAFTAFVPVNGSWDTYFQSLTSKRRYDLKRALKRAHQFGDLHIDIFAPNPDELAARLDTAFHVEAAGWKGRRGSSLLHNKPLGRFFSRYARKACAQGILRLGLLTLAGKPVAMLIGVECHQRFWLLKVGYDETYSRCSPGILLINASIQYAFERQLQSYEFLGSDEPWLHMWARGHRREHVSFGLFPPSLTAWSTLGGDIGRWGFKQLGKKLRIMN